ncbi:DUF1853 family protein [Stutzerimonas stutzeri]|uniref:DUF1853 family protein n=1 Tax=Stutzerimonas stutzeri TaxID=316 RepID=UPI001C2E4252|nr:DUF1853 family protein [Stutzerimonas stutzeri]
MNLPSLAELMPRLQHPQVRDLAWVLLSPPLLSDAPAPQRHPLAASRWLSRPDELADWLLWHDSQPSVLQAWLAHYSTRRLGLYYERLWQFALGQAPDVELVAANLAIRREGSTLGELDLILHDADGVHHIELAVKFYLGLETGDCRQHDCWLGPGSHDRLDIKLQRLCEHQLHLPTSAPAKAVLCELTCLEIDSALWLGGYLFQPWPKGCELPAGANPLHLGGHWLRYGEWLGATKVHGAAHWHPLHRHAWLAPAQLDDSQRWPEQDVVRWIDEAGTGQARLLARLERGHHGRWVECERLFVVPDAWPA